MARKFLVCAAASASKSSVRSLYFPYSAFSSFASARGAPVSAFGGYSVHAHTSQAPRIGRSHSFAMPARCLLRACSVASLEGSGSSCACPAHPVRAHTRPPPRATPSNSNALFFLFTLLLSIYLLFQSLNIINDIFYFTPIQNIVGHFNGMHYCITNRINFFSVTF